MYNTLTSHDEGTSNTASWLCNNLRTVSLGCLVTEEKPGNRQLGKQRHRWVGNSERFSQKQNGTGAWSGFKWLKIWRSSGML